MGWTEAATIIHAPVEAVWNSLNDIAQTPKWVVGLERAEIITDGDYSRGTIYNDYNRLGPVLQTTSWQVTVFEPMQRQVHVSDSAVLPTTMTLTLTPVPEGTRLNMEVMYTFLPQLGLFSRWFEGAVMNRILNQVLRQNQANLDVYLTQRYEPEDSYRLLRHPTSRKSPMKPVAEQV